MSRNKINSKIWEAVRDRYHEREKQLRIEFARSLPFQDAMFDRWERARSLGFEEGASIYNSALVFGDVRVGAGTWIGPYVLLDGSGGLLSIGSTCSISAGVQIYTHDTVAWALSGGVALGRKAGVRINDRCYVGSQSIISPGVEIGRCCVIAANSFVNSSVPDMTIVGGSPSRKLGHVEIVGETIRLVYDSDEKVVDLNFGQKI
jgi:carbonic anhydrase/acetyltransferase-like protein (isoleucine patch superfamily)